MGYSVLLRLGVYFLPLFFLYLDADKGIHEMGKQ